jgi:iron complex outermembrane receptor protein
VTVEGEINRGGHGQRVTTASFTPPANMPLDGSLDARGGYVLARWQRQITAAQDLQVQAYVDRTSWLAPHFGERRTTIDLDVVHRVQAGGRHAVTWGAGARWSPSTFQQVLPALDFTPANDTLRIYSGFVQDEAMVLASRLWLTAGLKLEHNSYTGLEAQPSARILWTPRRSQTVWASATRAVRIPSRIERAVRSMSYSSTTVVPIYIEAVGNDDVEAEELVGYEAGYRTLVLPQLYVDVAAFRNRHDGLSSFGPPQVRVEGSPILHAVASFPYVNGVDGTSSGIEIAPDWRPAAWWQLKGSYSYLRMDLRTTPASIDANAVSRYQGSSPHHQARLQAVVSLPRGVELAAAHRYVSGLPARGAPAYQTLDVRVGWRPQPRLNCSPPGRTCCSRVTSNSPRARRPSRSAVPRTPA